MKRFIGDDVQGGLLVMLAVTGVRLVVSGAFSRFVRLGMRLPLLGASLFIAALGVATLSRAWQGHMAHAAHSEDGQHVHRPIVGWLLALPVAVLLLVAPAPLGAYAAGRSTVRTTQLDQSVDLGVPPPPDADGAIAFNLGDYSNWALYDKNESIKDKPVRLVGFVAHDKAAPGGYFLTRFHISCCAADAYPIQVALYGTLPELADDTWVTVRGTWRATKVAPDGEENFRASLDVTSITELTNKPTPYEN